MGRAPAAAVSGEGAPVVTLYAVMSRRQHGHVAAPRSHSVMHLSWKACEQPGNLLTIPLLLAAAPASATSSSMQIGHCAAAASSPPEAIEFTSQVQLSVDDAFRKICRLQLVPLAFSLVNCDDGWGADL